MYVPVVVEEGVEQVPANGDDEDAVVKVQVVERRQARCDAFQPFAVKKKQRPSQHGSEEVEKLKKLTNFIVRYRGSDFTVEDFERNAKHYGYTEAVQANARQALEELVKMIESRAFPFTD